MKKQRNKITTDKKIKNKKWSPLIVFLVLITINILASFCYFRVDLTSEKRYSLAPATKNVLKILMIMYIFKFF